MASPFLLRTLCILWCSIVALFAFSTKASHLNETNDTVGTADRTPIYMGGFFGFEGWDTSGILVAVEMAIEHVNERHDILADYELNMIWNDTKVSPIST